MALDSNGDLAGYAFLHFDSMNVTNKKQIDGHEKMIYGKMLSMNEADSLDQLKQFDATYLLNLTEETNSNKKLKDLCNKFGEVALAKVADSGQSGRVEFVEREAVREQNEQRES